MKINVSVNFYYVYIPPAHQWETVNILLVQDWDSQRFLKELCSIDVNHDPLGSRSWVDDKQWHRT